MTTSGTYHHDFPHLAKQSGFYFQLHKGEVNWAEIEKLDVYDITENRNFQLLEQNLINVINFNLEKEYDLKILDRNLVKLFKVAQLGVDYLSYCEAYLDKCVVILQEQLIAFQEECEALKYEKEKRNEDEGRSKRKNKTQSYKCEKCNKAFISDVYLKFHDKRRHHIPNTPKGFNRNLKKYADNHQQTEDERKSTSSTQTATITQNEEDLVKIKLQHIEKIENMEQEIQELKERLRKAESALIEKTETPKFHSPSLGPMCHNTMLLLLPSCETQSGNSFDAINTRFLVSASENLQPNGFLAQSSVALNTVEGTLPPEYSISLNTEAEKTFEKRDGESPKAEIKSNAATKSFAELKRGTEEHVECDKENIDPNEEKTSTKISKPLPPPRKSKKVIPRRIAKEDTTSVELSVTPKRSSQPESETESLPSRAVVATSTPVKRKNSIDTITHVNKLESDSNENDNSRKGVLVEDASTSFFTTIVRKNSPKFRTFSQNLRRSLTNLRDSVSSTGKDLKESMGQNAKTTAANGLNHRLWQLGVDPEWTGIPKKTIKQKLKALKHRRTLLAKENPMYPIIRQNIEERIFHKLKKNLGSEETNLIRKLSQEFLAADDPALKNETADAKPQSCVMYNIESDSESNTSNSEIIWDEYVEHGDSKKTAELDSEPDPERVFAGKEFDLTVFQVGNTKKMPQKDVSLKVEELLTDLDADGDPMYEKNFRALGNFLSDKIKNEVAEKNNDTYKFTTQCRLGNQSILKGAYGLQSGLQMNAKKKVWFVRNSNDIEGLSDSVSDDNHWSLKSDWERDVG